MSVLNILLGIALILLGIWIAIAQFRAFLKNTPDTLGGHSSLLILRFGMVICGIIEICKNI